MLGNKFTKPNDPLVFLISAITSCIFLQIERLAGIDVTFHVDSVTYIERSTEMFHGIINSNGLSIFNNGYYVVVHLLQSNPSYVIALNIVCFSLANVILSRLHLSLTKNFSLIFLALILFNPYRLHLSTTILKDTIIILLLLLLFTAKNKYIILFPLVIFRIASLFYTTIIMSNMRILAVLILCTIVLLFNMEYINAILIFNEPNMNFRDGTLIPAFKEYGELGILMRVVLWPLLAITGGYFILTPSIFFFPLALGQLMQLIYMCKVGRFFFPFNILVGMMAFSVFVTGYATYLRYIFPLLVLMPFLDALRDRRNHEN